MSSSEQGVLPQPGDRVALMSRSLCRYEGDFDQVVQGHNSFILTNVTAFGTENRKASVFVARSKNIYDLVQFKASSVREMCIVDSKPVAKIASGLKADPAVVSARKEGKGPKQSGGSKEPSSRTQQRAGGASAAPPSPGKTRNGNGPPASALASPRSAAAWLNQRRASQGSSLSGRRTSSDNDLDDFDEATNEFNRLKVRFQESDGAAAEAGGQIETSRVPAIATKGGAPKSAYDKEKSFFDNLRLKTHSDAAGGSGFRSSSRQRRRDSMQTEERPAAMFNNQPNYSRRELIHCLAETFGQDSVRQLYGGRMGGGGNFNRFHDNNNYQPNRRFHQQQRHGYNQQTGRGYHYGGQPAFYRHNNGNGGYQPNGRSDYDNGGFRRNSGGGFYQPHRYHQQSFMTHHSQSNFSYRF